MISGKIVQLRGIMAKDASVIYDIVNREENRDLTGTVFPVSEYEHDRYMQTVSSSESKKMFAVYYQEKCIGTIGLKNIDYINSNAELFINLGEHIAGGGQML